MIFVQELVLFSLGYSLLHPYQCRVSVVWRGFCDE